jgi:hypothetical protein
VLARIVRASSNAGDLVADSFGGSDTTPERIRITPQPLAGFPSVSG